MANKLYKNSLIYIGLGFLAPAVNFFLVPIYTKHLDKSDYALITLATLVQSVLTPIIHLGITGSFSRYFYDYLDDRRKIDVLFSTTLVFLIFTGLLCCAIGFFWGDQLFSFFFTNTVFTFSKYGYFIIITTLAMNIQQLVLVYYRNYELSVKYAIWSVFFFLSAASFIYVEVAVLHQEALGSIRGRMLGSVFTLIPFLVLFFWRTPLAFSWSQCKHMLPYALPLVPYLLLTVAYAQFDKALVERNFSLNQLGEYGFATLIATVIDILISAVQSALYPQLYRLLSNHADGHTTEQITAIFRITILVAVVAIAALISFTGLGLHWFIDKRYWGIMHYFPLLCLVYVPRILFIVWSVPMMYFKKTKYLPLSNGFSLIIGITLGSLLIKSLGIFAIPVALFVMQLSQIIVTYILNQKLNINLPSFQKLTKEYGLLLFLLFGGLLATFLYSHLFPTVLIYLPLFFLVCVFIVVLYFNQIKTKLVSLQPLNRIARLHRSKNG